MGALTAGLTTNAVCCPLPVCVLHVQSVRYIGPTKFSGDEWVGVCLDLPVGKNDGSVDGVRYFYCPKASGVFVRPHTVTLDTQVQPLSPGDGHTSMYSGHAEEIHDGPGSAGNGAVVSSVVWGWRALLLPR